MQMKDNSLSYYVQNYFLSYLISRRGYGDNTIASYRDTFRLLFMFLESEGKKLSKLEIGGYQPKLCTAVSGMDRDREV